MESLVFWMSWSINTVASGNRQHLRLTGDAKTLYNQGTSHSSGISSLSGRCNASSTITFEKACEFIVYIKYDFYTGAKYSHHIIIVQQLLSWCNSFVYILLSAGVYRIHYSYSEYSQNEVCMQAADPRSLNFRPGLGTDTFTLEFDMQSVMTVMGVNYGVIDHEVLEEVPFTRGELLLNGKMQAFANYYNPRYPNMNVITCFANENSTANDFWYDRVSICAVEIGITPLYPVFNHLGYDKPGFNDTLYCDCSEEVLSDRELSYQCNKFLMMTGRLNAVLHVKLYNIHLVFTYTSTLCVFLC
jgi:hypothetical protein